MSRERDRQKLFTRRVLDYREVKERWMSAPMLLATFGETKVACRRATPGIKNGRFRGHSLN
jgi:hypothetical protein